MTPDTLDQLSDAELSEVFAVELAGWRDCHEGEGIPEGYASCSENMTIIPPFAFAANLVLPWLDSSAFDVQATYSNTCTEWTVRLLGRFVSAAEYMGRAETFARAACIALIRAKRANNPKP